jgi:hypothetical protein
MRPALDAIEREGSQAIVLRVGDGRGSVVEHRNPLRGIERLVFTAAHCLTVPRDRRFTSTPEPPCLPAAHPGRYEEEAVYDNLLGPLGGECTVSAECIFVDPIADIAVLGTPDRQIFYNEAAAFDALVASIAPLPIADGPAMRRIATTTGVVTWEAGKGEVCVLSLDGRWRTYQIERCGDGFAVLNDVYQPGMSGSPVLNSEGAAIGVVSTAEMSPILFDVLPAGLLRTTTGQEDARDGCESHMTAGDANG